MLVPFVLNSIVVQYLMSCALSHMDGLVVSVLQMIPRGRLQKDGYYCHRLGADVVAFGDRLLLQDRRENT